KEAILETQQSSRRYYQRPDADYLELDPERTSLSGHGGTVEFSKFGRGHLRFNTGFTWRSPGLELNDVGFLRDADTSMQWVWVGYQIWKPFSIFRNFNVDFNQWQGWDFGGTRTFAGGNISFSTMFKNYWNINVGINRDFDRVSNRDLRGGPSFITPGGWNQWLNLSTDQRKKVRLHLNLSYNRGDDQAARRTRLGGGIQLQPTNALSFSLFPSFTWNKNQLQYVDTVDFGTEPRYILGKIDQKTLAVTIRMDLSLSTDLTIQFYGQPFISVGKYTDLKYVTNPRADQFDNRFHTYSENEISYDPVGEIYNLDETNNGTIDYVVDQPNFNFLQFRSNLVLRWEYNPGSTVFVVWSQGRTDYDSRGEFSFSDDFRNLFKVKPHNVFLVKFTHRFDF
ncbi:MAG: hypothetical protein GY940_19540, partial [bacterium]|nr:hypothetical protein [bacterium]